MDRDRYQKYISILKRELRPAMGCTEPIALAYAAAKGRELLGAVPDKVRIRASGSIIKNTKSVIVPNTGKMKGIPAAVAAGIIGGRSELELEVLSKITKEQIAQIEDFLIKASVSVEPIEEGPVFEIQIEEYKGEENTIVRIVDYHTNIVYLKKNEKVLMDKSSRLFLECETPDDSFMNMQDIWEFANEVDVEEVRDVIQRQMDYNWRIAVEGMEEKYGANIGKILSSVYGEGTRNLACAMAAAGSDARMNGCELPVVVNSGSGNQGMTVCIPVLVYAKKLKSEEESILRALILANLTALYEKTGIGRLSAYCGAVSAGAAAAAGIAYLHGEDYDTVVHTIVHALAISSGIICDGAKASCAAKIAVSVYTGLLGYEMYKGGEQFYAGDGIVAADIEETLRNVGHLASNGMRETNQEIIRMMTQ